MSFTNRISRALHEEHRATVALAERVQALIAGYRQRPPNVETPGVVPLLADLTASLETEVWRHFDFEEGSLFAYFEDGSDCAIAAHLLEEHAAIRPIGADLATLAREATAQGFDAARWNAFRRLGQDFCQRILAHVQKEEAALLPLIEEAMDADTEARLYRDYVENA